MDEFKINNIEKINAINFINISDSKSPQNPSYTIKKIPNNAENSKIKKNTFPKGFSNILKINSRYNNNAVLDEGIKPNNKPHFIYDVSDKKSLPFPVNTISLHKPRNKKILAKTEKQNSKSIYSFRRTAEPDFCDFTNFTENYSDANIDSFGNTQIDNCNQNEMMIKSKNILYEKQLAENKTKYNILLNKFNFCMNHLKKKDMEIINLQKKNKALYKELSVKKSLENKNINKSEENFKELIYNTKLLNIKNTSGKNPSYNKAVQNNELKNMNLNNQNTDDINIIKKLDEKNKEIQFLHQKLQKMKKDIEVMSLKNTNLSKLLTKKNMELITYQKNEIEKEKKIEELTSEIFQQSNHNNIISNKIENDEKKRYIKLNEKINSLKKEIISKNNKIKELNDEKEAKNKQIDELLQKINELEININGMKSEGKQNFFDINKYKNDILTKEGEIKEISKKLNLYQNEKNNLLNNISNKENEINSNKNKILELNNLLEESRKNLEEKGLEITKYINENKILTEQLENQKYNKNKEDNILLKKIEELSGQNNKLLNQINTINSKYYEQKKKLLEESKKLQNIEKARLKEEQEKQNLNPEICRIIANKRFKKLIWFLIYKKPTINKDKNDKKNNENEENNYDNYFWVTNDKIKNDDLKKFNKFEDDNDKNNELKEYVINLQQKLEKKEEDLNKLDYQNKKLTKELLNKTANLKGNIKLIKNSKDNNFPNSFNDNKTLENEVKYKNIFEKLNKREKHLNNQITILKEQLNEKKNLENNFPHDMKNIDPHLHDSGFLDDDSEDNKNNIEIHNLVNEEKQNIKENNELNSNIPNENDKENKNDINENNIEKMDLHDNGVNEINRSEDLSSKEDPFKESEKKVDEFLMNGAGDEDDYDEVKMINKQMNFLKDEIKESREKNKKLGDEIKDLFFKIKCNDKNRKNIVQICQLLGFQPQLVDQIISNKKLKK